MGFDFAEKFHYLQLCTDDIAWLNYFWTVRSSLGSMPFLEEPNPGNQGVLVWF